MSHCRKLPGAISVARSAARPGQIVPLVVIEHAATAGC